MQPDDSTNNRQAQATTDVTQAAPMPPQAEQMPAQSVTVDSAGDQSQASAAVPEVQSVAQPESVSTSPPPPEQPAFAAPEAPAPADPVAGVADPQLQVASPSPQAANPAEGGSKKTTWIVLAVIVVVVALGLAAYMLL